MLEIKKRGKKIIKEKDNLLWSSETERNFEKRENSLGEGNSMNKNLLKQTLFTVAYYNALGYYPTSFFIWKNLIDLSSQGKQASFLEVVGVISKLVRQEKIVVENGMHKIVESQKSKVESRKWKVESRKWKVESEKSSAQDGLIKNWKVGREDFNWYKTQIQKNKISTEKIKKARMFARASRWVPYLRGILLTGTLAMKRGGNNSDWDVMVVLKKNRIWLGRFFISGWFQLIGKRRHGKKINNRFCLNQFVVDGKLKFTEHNEFFGNELIASENLMEDEILYNKIMDKNKKWLRLFRPNFKNRQFVRKEKNDKINNLLKFVQVKLENILEVFDLAEMMNGVAKKIMIYKIAKNPKTYEEGADIRYSDFFLVFLPRPQRETVRRLTFKLLTKINL